jgi:phosphoesterase RecJ-like protein
VISEVRDGRGLDFAEQIREIARLLQSKNRIAVLTHNTADGDTLGSGLALCLAFRKLGKDACLIYEEQFPDNLSDMFSGRDFLRYVPDDENVLNSEWDSIAVVDTADPKLLGRRAAMLGRTDCMINIDHHISNSGFGLHNLIDPSASSAAEVVYKLIVELGAPFDRDIALAIYTGVCTDTGGFSYSNTNGESHVIAAWALRYGLDVAHMRYKFFDAISLGKLHCHGYVANSLRIHNGGKIAIAIVTASALENIGATESDCEGLVNIGRNVVGVEVSVFAREVRPGEFRVNFRSRGDSDVASIARIFEGGGHKLAAGCTILASPGDIESILLEALM